MRTITLGNHVKAELMESQLEFAKRWRSDRIIRLQFLAYPSDPFLMTDRIGEAILDLFGAMAQNHISLKLQLYACRDNPCFRKILRQARRLGLLQHLVLADCTSALPLSATPDMSEILSSPCLQHIEINFQTKHSTSSGVACGRAIASNPCVQTLTLYTYEDDSGTTTSSLLQELKGHSTLKVLHLYCPKTAIPAIVGLSLIDLLSSPGCSLSELEISCIKHHRHSGAPHEVLRNVDHHQDARFPLDVLVQRGLVHNRSLQKLGLFHAELTTDQVDQDLLSCLWKCSPNLQIIDLYANLIDSLYFPNFMASNQSCCLKELHVRQNPCLLLSSPSHPQRHHRHHPHHYPATTTTVNHDMARNTALLHMLEELYHKHDQLYFFGLDHRHLDLDTTTQSLAPTTNIHSTTNTYSPRGSPLLRKHHRRRRLNNPPSISWLTYLADVNRTGVRRNDSSIASLPQAMWPRLFDRTLQMLLLSHRSLHPPRSKMLNLTEENDINESNRGHHRPSRSYNQNHQTSLPSNHETSMTPSPSLVEDGTDRNPRVFSNPSGNKSSSCHHPPSLQQGLASIFFELLRNHPSIWMPSSYGPSSQILDPPS